jgi:hypothetical protein
VLTDKANVLETCQNLAASLGSMLMTSRQGQLQIVQLVPATGAADATVVTVDDMVNGSIKLVERSKVSGSVKLGYCRNWAPQDQLQSGIPESSANLLKLDWISTTQTDPATIQTYRLHAVPEMEETALQVEADAIIEAKRRRDFRKVQRSVYQYTGFADSLDLRLGKEVFLSHPRYGLSAGKYGVIIGLEPDWLNRRCNVKVMI